MGSHGAEDAKQKTVASQSSFLELCQLFEKLLSCKLKQKRYETLCKYVSDFRRKWKSLHKEGCKTTDSYFPVLRLMVPSLDRARGPYGVKEHTLARIYVRILCLPKEGSDATKLLNYRVPKFAGSVAGDFAEVAYWVLNSRCPQSSQNISVEDVNKHLDNLAKYHASHEPRMIDQELMEMLRTLSALEQKWLIRIILKSIKFKLGTTSIFSAFHRDARGLFDVRNDLEKVCITLMDPAVKLHELEVELFSHVTPMLSERTDPAKVSKLLESSAGGSGQATAPSLGGQGGALTHLLLETKLDGERFQLHMCAGQFKFFSHNGFDYTDNFGKNKSCSGTLASLIGPLFHPQVKSVILDGEMMVWDFKYSMFKTKGHCFDVKKLKCSKVNDDGNVQNQRYQPCFCAFDVLYYNGQVLTGKPLNERIPILKSIFRCQEGVIAYSPVTREVTKREDIVDALNKAIDAREEGIILKEPTSLYRPRERKGGWYKIKPEYIGEVCDTLDLLIIGGFYGGGRGKGIISHFLLGVAVPPSSLGEDPKEFHSVGRVGSGYSFDELEELLGKIAPYWKEVKPNDASHEQAGIVWTKERPDVWLPPCKSCVLKVKATEIARSDAFKTGYTLRFPRVECVRYDKRWCDCMTTSEFHQLRELASGKLYSRHIGDDDTSPRKRMKMASVRKASLPEKFRGIDASALEMISDSLQGKEICVLNGNEKFSKQQLETLVVQFGGTIAQNPGRNTYCAVVGNEAPIRVANIIKAGNHNVVRASWLVNVCSSDSACVKDFDWKPEEVLALTKEAAHSMRSHYDCYGDSYTEPLTHERLVQIMGKMDSESGHVTITQEEIAEMDQELFSGPSPFSIFRLCRGCFDCKNQEFDTEPLSNPTDVAFFIEKSNFQIHSGVVADDLDDLVSHVIVESSSCPGIERLMEVNSKRSKKFHLVTLDWVRRSCAQRKRLEEFPYHPKNPDMTQDS
ncbi:DNA ligase 4 [Ischnura elegans]|uniref:DNA ligase 4 n=1 Tax=Ischnura elegans TaxID=197161 RepID=UPI001ED8A3F9|nr:DNA ligase 4 [Ischnura elegans]XP_046387083.1 DNA ligase 4 [Ischnura elegans]